MSGSAGEEGFKDKNSEMLPAGHQYADGAKHVWQARPWKLALLSFNDLQQSVLLEIHFFKI